MAKGNNSRTVSDFTTDISVVKSTFKRLFPSISSTDELYYLFEVALTDLSLFPNKTLSKDDVSLEAYLKKWVSGYQTFELPTEKVKRAKGTCSDPAIKEMVKIVYSFDDATANYQSEVHDIFMAAENAQGDLIEEYIAGKIKPFGWLWCRGETIHSVDFCTKDGLHLLQIKNKNNTENSSSSSVRNGTIIEKWYRLGSKSEKGVIKPVYKWDELNKIINDSLGTASSLSCDMSEEDYIKFLKAAVTKNPKIIKD